MLRALWFSLAMLAAANCVSAAQVSSLASTQHPTPTPTPKTAAGSSLAESSFHEDSAAENELLQSANQDRKLADVPQLRMDDGLRTAALAHAQRMIAAQQLEHRFSGELPLLERIAEVSPLRMDRAGENLAAATCASSANEALMRSPPHRANLLDGNFNVVGIAAVWDEGRLYVVQDFGHQLPTYSTQQSGQLVGGAVDELRQQAGLSKLIQMTPPNLDAAACKLASENRPNAHLLATAYDNRKIIAYTQSRPEALPQGALRMLHDPGLRKFAVGSCYARNATYPTGMYWVAILLY
jgi:uncharacterized protein YkwD